MSRSSNWDQDLINKLIILYNEGKYSTKQIGDMLGFSKNAIVGKIHRLELNKNKTSSVNNINKDSFSERVTTKDTNLYADAINYENTESNNIKEVDFYKLEDINFNMCVWPYGEENFTFCGKKVLVGKPYCKDHYEKAYLKFNKKTRKI